MAKIQTLMGGGSGDVVAMANCQRQSDQIKTLSERRLNSDKEVEKAATGFEALMLQQMFKSMFSTVEYSGMFGNTSLESKMYRDMLNQAIADSVAEGEGIGLKDVISKELVQEQAKKGKEISIPSPSSK